ncbi:unnamed protein product [Lasius platythorax]|uniref:Uncharacterized protein n=1 Tax=Lasius platythorax TaxID=488582 RepID=A0AAV2PD06_9HYME
MFRIKNTADYSSQSTLQQSESSARKIPQPVKITELIGSCKKSQNDQSNSAVKSLPERLTPYLKSASNRKKNGTNTHGKLSHSKRNVRRNLNFTKIPTIVISSEPSSTSSNNVKNSKEGNLHVSSRKSFLMPRNTIKDLYVNNRSCPSLVRDTNAQVDSVIHEEVNKTVIQHLSSQMFTVNDQSKINILHSNCTDTKNNAVEKEIPKSSINVEENKCLSMYQMINQSCVNLKHGTNDDEYITFNKTELTVLASKLKHDMHILEEDIIPNMRSMFTIITDRLSATNKETDNNDIDNKIMEQKTENLNDNINIINNVKTKSLCAINNINTEDSNIPKEVYKTPDTNLMKFVETDVCGKNNSKIQSSCQIDLTSESNKENDSFVNLENNLDITNIKSSTTIISLTKRTPVLNKYKDKTVGRPLKEYMALKSRMSCLLTPNINRFNCSQSKNDNLHSETGDAKASLSGKILAELYNLYED